MELRCEGRLFGVLSEDHSTIEVKCTRRKCGYKPGLVVLHQLSLSTGQVKATNIYQDPSHRED